MFFYRLPYLSFYNLHSRKYLGHLGLADAFYLYDILLPCREQAYKAAKFIN